MVAPGVISNQTEQYNILDCNFVFDNDGLAKTEDRVIVYNIFLYKISRKVGRDEVKLYFEQFGEIKKLQFIVKRGNGRRRGSRVGFVHFKEAKAASKVLKMRCHRIDDSKLIYVKACDSWHQPQDNYCSIEDEEKSAKDATETPVQSNDTYNQLENAAGTITTLDDDCLFIVFKTMNLRDQVNFACSHPRFESIFKLYAKLNYKTIRADDLEDLSLWNIRQFLIFAGQFIEIFTGSFQHKYRDRIANFIAVHCPNLQKLNLDTTRMKLTSLRKIIFNKPKLTTLNLIDCGISDHGVYAISKLTQLESLVISRNSNITGQHLCNLKNLTKLRLFCCGFLQLPQLLKALSSMPNLRFLDLRGPQQLGKALIEKLPQICKNLEVLQISCNDMNYESIARIPKLKNLSLSASCPTHLRVELFWQFVNEEAHLETLHILPCLYVRLEHCEYISKLKNLKQLHLSPSPGLNDRCLTLLSELQKLEELKISGCKKITNDGVLEIVLQCKKLKWVNIQNTDINNNFAHKLLYCLKEDERPNGCISFLVAGSKISKLGMPENYNSEKVRSIVYFDFDLPKTLTTYNRLNDEFESNDLAMDLPFFSIDNMYVDSDEDDSDDEFIGFGFDYFDVDDFDAEMLVW